MGDSGLKWGRASDGVPSGSYMHTFCAKTLSRAMCADKRGALIPLASVATVPIVYFWCPG